MGLWDKVKNLLVWGDLEVKGKTMFKGPVTGVMLGSPGTTVVTEKTYGQAQAVGALTSYAREDHTHGTPPRGVEMDFGHYTGTGIAANKDVAVAFTPDFIQVSHAENLASGIVGHRTPDMSTPAAFCIVVSDLAGVGLPGILPTAELTQPVASQFRVTGNLNIVNKEYYWVAFKKLP